MRACFVLVAARMTKLLATFALALSLAACVTEEDIGTPPQPVDGQDDESQEDDDRQPIDPGSGLSDPGPTCVQFGGKGDGPCAP